MSSRICFGGGGEGGERVVHFAKDEEGALLLTFTFYIP